MPRKFCAVRRCCLRMEVEDLDLFAAAAVGGSWRQSEPGVTGEDGSSLDEVAPARYCRMGRPR